MLQKTGLTTMKILYYPLTDAVNENQLLGSLFSLGLQAEPGASAVFPFLNEPGLIDLQQAQVGLRRAGSADQGRFGSQAEKVIETLVQAAELFAQAGFDAPASVNSSSLASLLAYLRGLDVLGIGAIYAQAMPLVPRSGPEERLVECVYQVCQVRVRPVLDDHQSISWLAAACLASLAKFRLPDFRLIQAGPGFVLGELDDADQAGNVLIQTSMDDISPQLVSYAIERLFEAGALDVYQVPITMKKNRLGIQLNVTARQEDEARLAGIILRETTTLGVNVRPLDHRYHAETRMVKVDTKYGVIPVKQKFWDGQLIQSRPEYAVIAKIATQFQISLDELNFEIRSQLKSINNGD